MSEEEDYPALQLLHAQLAALDKYPPGHGCVPGMQMTWTEIQEEFRQQILGEMAKYRQWKAGMSTMPS